MSEQQSTATAGQPPNVDAAPSGGPTPQMIGIRFVKTYYQVLSTTPDRIFKFYKPSSVLSHGEGSTPTNAVDFEKYDLKERWGEAQRFDFDNGAIDAQPSADGSILLVVTGHVVVKTEDGKEERKGFVHTFFLALVSLPNKQKTYYVKNDILRFLNSDGLSAVEAVPAAPTPAPATVTPEVSKEDAKPVEEPAVVPEEPVEEEKKVDTPEDVAEEKTDAPKEEPKAKNKPAPTEEKPKGAKEQSVKETISEPKKKEGGKGKRQRGRGKSPQNAAKQQPASKPTPGSWASLVASGSGPTATPAPKASSTPSKPPAPEKTERTPAKSNAQPKKEDKGDAPNTKENGKSNKDKPKRDPDNTLVIKGLPDGTKEAELLAIFEPFAAQANAKIVSSTISSHRGLAFVDYDSVAPVMAAVEQHKKEPFQLNGKVLEVDQKTAEQRARKSRGGYRSGSPNQNNNNNNRGSGGGRQNKRNNGGGRGNKGNRGGGNNNNDSKGGGGGGVR